MKLVEWWLHRWIHSRLGERVYSRVSCWLKALICCLICTATGECHWCWENRSHYLFLLLIRAWDHIVIFENEPRIIDFPLCCPGLKLSSVFISDKSEGCVTLEIGWVSLDTLWIEAWEMVTNLWRAPCYKWIFLGKKKQHSNSTASAALNFLILSRAILVNWDSSSDILAPADSLLCCLKETNRKVKLAFTLTVGCWLQPVQHLPFQGFMFRTFYLLGKIIYIIFFMITLLNVYPLYV